MAKTSVKKLATAFVTLLEKHDLSVVVELLAKEIVARKLTHDIDHFLQEVSSELWRRHQHLTIWISSASALSAALRREVEAYIVSHFQATSTEVITKNDPKLKGGVIVHTALGDFDASIVAKLNQLKEIA